LKDVNKLLTAKQLKFIMIAPDMEPNKGEGGLDATVEAIKAAAENQRVPYIFALKRRKLGYILHKKVPVSCVGIFFYDGCEEIVKKLLELVSVEREKYKNCGK
jgi:selenocysteine insertion sequence-binding protein 2